MALINSRKIWCLIFLALGCGVAGFWWWRPGTVPQTAAQSDGAERLESATAPPGARAGVEPAPSGGVSAVTAALEVPASIGGAVTPPTPATEFDSWMRRYLAVASDSEKTALLAEGEVLATQRREFLFNLIQTDPEAALAAAVPMSLRGDLPGSIQALLEERVGGRGFFGVMVADYPEQGRREVSREFRLNGQRYDAFVYGRRLNEVTRERASLWGIALSDSTRKVLAVHQDAVRVADYREAQRANAPLKNCPISSLPANTHGTPVFGEVDGKFESFCGAGHLAALNQRLAADGGAGGDGTEPPIAYDGWTQGGKAVLFMRVTYPDDPTEAITEIAAAQLMDTVNSWFVETSYDTTALITDVTPLMILPQTKAWYCENGDGFILSDSREIARSHGYDTDNYSFDIVRFPSPGSGCDGYGYGGKAYVRGKGCWMLSNSSGTQIHELGHNYGVWHANFWTGVGEGVISHGSHVEYGNSFDVMGSSGSSGQFNAAFKNILDWLQDPFVETVTSNGTYRIHTYDLPNLAPGQKYALKIRKDYDRNYWAEFRQKFNNRWFQSGVMLNWDAWNNGVTNSGSGTHLLDTTPGTPTGNSSKEDSPVIVGRTFSDLAAGVHITPVAKGNDSPENWIDVVVNLGSFAGNSAPTASVTADRANVAVNGTVNFSAVAGDADGDALAYGWDFGDLTFGPNAPNVSKSWTNSGEFVVRCLISDMKGGLYSRNLVIAVGSPATFRASGRIAANGLPLEGVRVHNGLSGAAYRGAYTDSDGNYVIAGLAAGNHNISAVEYGYTLARSGWGSPVTVGPSATSLDWVGTALPRVGIAVTDGVVSEAGLNPGTLSFTRTGPTTAPLTVKLNRTGSASSGTDYSLSPSPSGSPLQLVIPAGVSSLEVTLTPQSDGSSEGPEKVTLTLIEDAAYVTGPSSEVSVTLEDDEPAVRPTITITASNSDGPEDDNIATESGSDLGVFRINRTGNVANEITVLYSVSGSAVSGVDYSGLFGVAVIPAGQTMLNVPLTAIDDVEVEGFETVTATLVANAAYTVGSPASATVTIVDDDPPTVTIVATDNIAAETGGNTAAFVVTRVGSLAPNLVVHYTLEGTAVNGTDFSTLSGSVTILAGRPNATVTLTSINDTDVEGAETVVVNLGSSPSYNVGNPGSATIVLQDDETPTVTVAVADGTATEPGSDIGSFRFTRTGGTGAPLTVLFSVAGNAIPGSDYTALGSSIEIPAGSTTALLIVTPLDDLVPETIERVLVQLAPSPAYNVGTAAPQLVNLRDNDAGLPAVGFSYATFSGPENDTSVRLSVQLSTNTAAAVTVNYAVTGGTASGGGTDFTLAGGVLRFLPSTNNQSITFTVNNDALVEADETILVTLSAPANAQLDAVNTMTYTIVDDDGSGNVTVSALDAVAAENGESTGLFRISRSGGTGSEITVPYQIVGSASSPADFLPLGNSATIPAGVSFVDILVTPVDDQTDETNETVILNLLPFFGAKLGSPDVATISIVDNDTATNLPIVTVTAMDDGASEPGVNTGTFRIARDGETNDALLVTFSVGGSATSGTDFIGLGTSATIPAGAYETLLTLTPSDDLVFESNETVVVTLTMPSHYLVGTPASATVTIQDNEAGVSVVAEGSSSEDGSTLGSFVVTRTGSTASALAVNFSVAGTAGIGDFVPLGVSVVIPAGTNAAAVTVVPIDDALPEGNETVVLTIAAGAGYTITAPNAATLVLLDDEPGVSIAASDATAYEGGGDPGVFTVARTGSTVGSLTVSFTIGGNAANGSDYVAIADSAVFQPGQSSIDIPVLPLDDLEAEGNETVQLTLNQNPAYAVLGPATALVTINDDEINLLPVVTITSPAISTVYLAGAGSALVLEADATDDGRPNPPSAVSTAWSKVSGPGAVTFGDSNAVNTTVRFSVNGSYVIRLTASDSILSASDDLNVVVAPDAVLAPGLQAYWKFDQTNGSVALDSSFNARNASLANGAFFAAGRFNNALELDGADDRASFSSMALAQLTVTAWIHPDSQGDSTTPRLLAMPGYNIRIRRDTSSTTNALALESSRSGTTGEWRSPGDVVSDGAWYHVAVSYDSSSTANAPVFYVNGVAYPAAIRTTPSGTQNANTGTGYIGNAAALDRSWDGRIDDLRIYNRVLSAAELQLIAAGPATNLAPLVDAGPARTISLTGAAVLDGRIIEDGQPNPPGAVTSLWFQVSGSGTVEFDDPASVDTVATFSEGGVYVLRLLANDGQVQMADDVTITVIAPTRVSLEAVDSTAAEFGEQGGLASSGLFMVSREGDLSAPLPVLLTIGGTSSNGLDYASLSNVIVIPANQPSVNFSVLPIRDGLAEGEETVEVAVLSDPGYLVGVPSSDTVYLQDAPWDEWRLGRFSAAERLDPDISGELADPDLDRLSNLLEYACGLDPKTPDATSGFSGAIETVNDPGGAVEAYVVRFHRRLPPTDLLYEVQVTGDFSTWISGPNVTRELFPRQDDGNDTTETSRVRLLESLSPSGSWFVRLKVRLQ